jgi:UDP-2,3-diacylglucosamine pyrophosphatase LpxH
MNYKTIWISDLHLGTRGCDAQGVLEFLRRTDCETLYLVGDVVDLWSLKREFHWPLTHNDVIQRILHKARTGTRVIYIPGNHDEFGRNFLGAYGEVWVKQRDLYVTGRGERLLIMHGHEFDAVTQHAQWLATLGDIGYQTLLRLNRPLNLLRRAFGRDHWSLSAYVKSRVKNAVSFISQFEDAVVRYAEMYDVDGIVCGHIHTPVVKQIRDVRYYNCGDWVESSTALVERHTGRLELVRWRQVEAAETIRPLAAELVGA